jgi:hypothetical protein
MKATEKCVFAMLLLTAALVVSCSKDDCPVCTEQDKVVAILHAEYHEADEDESKLLIWTMFFGDPIPRVTYVRANGSDLSLAEEDAVMPIYSLDCDSLADQVDIRAIVDGSQLANTVSIPDSFWITEPEDLSLVPADNDLNIRWSQSEGATSYRLRLVIPGLESGTWVDTLLYVDSLAFTLPAGYLVEGNDVHIQLAAVSGPVEETGQPGNIRSQHFQGFAVGLHHVPDRTVFVSSLLRDQ